MVTVNGLEERGIRERMNWGLNERRYVRLITEQHYIKILITDIVIPIHMIIAR